MKWFVAATMVVLVGCSEAHAPNPWVRWHSKAAVRELIIACGKVEVPRASRSRDYEAQYTVEAPLPYQVYCGAIYDDETARLSSMFVSIFGPHGMEVTLDEILPVAEFILRELPPESRAIARRVATSPEVTDRSHRAQEIIVGSLTIAGGISASGMWNLHVWRAR